LALTAYTTFNALNKKRNEARAEKRRALVDCIRRRSSQFSTLPPSRSKSIEDVKGLEGQLIGNR
jgi:hypothetical protein